MSTSSRELARRIAALERRTTRGAPSLIHSTIEGGSAKLRDDGGALVGFVGKQWDSTYGAYVVGGPQPPTPAAPTVTSKNGQLLVEWHGDWDPATVSGQPVVAPMDFGRAEVHVGTLADLPAGVLRSTLKSFISTSRGAISPITVDYDTDLYAWLVVRSLGGVASAPSPVVGPIQAEKLTAADLDIDAVLGNKIFYGPATPTTDRTGDLWLKEVAAGPPVKHELRQWDGDSWELTQDQTAVAAALAASNAQAAADLKLRLYSQDAAPTGLGASDKALWQDTNDGNKPYIWDGDSWEPRLIGNSAIQPASLVASTILVTGSITAPLLEAIMVLANVIILGDPTGEHTRLDNVGLFAYAVDDDDLPIELGRFGRGFSGRSPTTNAVAYTMSDEGNLDVATLDTIDGDPTFGGVHLSQMFADYPLGIVARGELPDLGAATATTNTETAIAALALDAKPGRHYVFNWPAIEYVVATGDKAVIRLRYTVDGTAPSTSSPQVDAWALEEVDSAFNTMIGWQTLLPTVTVPTEMRFLVCMATSGGSTGLAANLSGRIRHFWIEDKGPAITNSGDVLITTGTTSSGGGTTPVKKQYTYEAEALWQRTWNQGGSVIYDDEMHQGYGDSFNGIRKSAAGWDGLVGLLAGATIDSVEFYLESYHWWNMSGGTAVIGYHSQNTEPAGFPGHNDTFSIAFTARSQGKWIKVSGGANGKSWGGITQNGTCRGFSLAGPSTAASYYSKFRGDAYGRPRIRVKYTK